MHSVESMIGRMQMTLAHAGKGPVIPWSSAIVTGASSHPPRTNSSLHTSYVLTEEGPRAWQEQLPRSDSAYPTRYMYAAPSKTMRQQGN